MQSQAYRITGFAAVMGAVGFMVRWIQSMKIYDEATGLADRGAPINFWVIGILVVTLAALAVWTFRLRRSGFFVHGLAPIVQNKKGRAARMWAALPSLGLLYWISRRSTRANFHKKKPTNRCGLDKSRHAPLL